MSLKQNSLLDIFARHKVAANLLMLAMFLAGAWSLTRLNTQFLPNFDVNIITVNVIWPGASAEDVERSIILPMETELRTLDYVKEMKSSSRIGLANITIEFEQGTDMGNALEQVKEKVSQVRNLPQNAEEPVIEKQENFEEIAKLIITGSDDINELRPFVRSIEKELLDIGIAKVEVTGLPEDEIAIQVPSKNLAKLSMSLEDIAQKIAAESQDVPTGSVGKGSVSKQLRAKEQRRSVKNFETIPLKSDAMGQLIQVRDVAKVTQRPKDYEPLVFYKGHPAVELTLYRTENADSLASAKILKDWYQKNKASFTKNLTVKVYDESWQLIEGRIVLLLKNGLGGFVLILILLFLFLNRRVAFWVAMGIPISFSAALFILYVLGGSINMVSLFAMIMTLGIIVDDTVVVGEESLSLLQKNYPPQKAVVLGAKRMLAPVLSSSLTTTAAFLPLFMVGEIIGEILSAIPLVVIAVIIASVIECFFVLPGHLFHSFKHMKVLHAHPMPFGFDKKFEHFKEYYFRRFVSYAITHRFLTLSITFVFILFNVGLVIAGHVNFNFFPSPDGKIILLDAQFHAGTPENKMKQFMNQALGALHTVDKDFKDNGPIVKTAVSTLFKGSIDKGQSPEYASMRVELSGPDERDITNKQFIDTWRKAIPNSSWISNLLILSPRAGPPGEDIDVQLYGASAKRLKIASEALKQELAKYKGVSNIIDDLPYGQEQLIFSLKPEAKALGLTVNNISQQIRGAFTGALAQIYHVPDEEIEVRVKLPKNEREDFKILEQFPIITSTGSVVPLYSVVSFKSEQGFDILNHTDTKLTVRVTAEVDPNVSNNNKILNNLSKAYLPELTSQYGVKYSLEGRAEEQADTLEDMQYGMFLALGLIYIILAWVFASYGWPLVVMTGIPMGLAGAILGHWIMGHDLTVLSLFGFFGLSGIVINDSIILITRYKELRKDNKNRTEAIIEASCQRLRAVLLTSLTTIAGLTPLMFERSLQAQFLIPMAITITFGLAFGTMLILIVIPTLLSLYEDGLLYLNKFIVRGERHE